nr:MAG TPA: hypothetical protein [Caudoviricetes sp.]
MFLQFLLLLGAILRVSLARSRLVLTCILFLR